ncbi:MAG: biopolymer transporter ExbD [Acidobacteria bacterium]|nr:biopolymer transporter ExbD [Acidobacteriota bacterium]
MSIQSNKQTSPNINVTPLIDVLLVLLIIFMVITPIDSRKFDTKIPEKPDSTQEELAAPPTLLVVSIDKDLQLSLNSQTMNLMDLTSSLKQILSERTPDQKTLFIKAPKNVRYEFVANVIDGIKGAGASPIGLQVDYLE